MGISQEDAEDIIVAFKAGVSLLKSTTKRDRSHAKRIEPKLDLLVHIISLHLNVETPASRNKNWSKQAMLDFLDHSYADREIYLSSHLYDTYKNVLSAISQVVPNFKYEFIVDESLNEMEFRVKECWLESESRRVCNQVFVFEFKSIA